MCLYLAECSSNVNVRCNEFYIKDLSVEIQLVGFVLYLISISYIEKDIITEGNHFIKSTDIIKPLYLLYQNGSYRSNSFA